MMFNWLFLKRVEHFQGRLEGDDEPAHYIRSTWIPAPGVIVPWFLFVLCTLWYGLFLALGVYVLGGSLGYPLFGAVGLLGANATIRASLKYRERIAMQAQWHEPVGREMLMVRVAAIVIGAILAGAAGYVLCLDPTLRAKFVTPLIPMVALAAIEGTRNGARIGGRSREDEPFDITECQTIVKRPLAKIEFGDKP